MFRLLPFLQTPWADRYTFAGRMLVGHRDAIHTLAMTRKGKYLASGGKPADGKGRLHYS
jgi:hypothetical protein